MTMTVRHYSDGMAFLDRAGTWLGKSEVAHSLMIGLAKKVGGGPPRPGHAPIMVTVEDQDKIVACALRTPPNKVLLTRGSKPALTALAEDLLAVYGALPAALGPVPDVDAFAGIWESLTGARVRRGMHQRIFECRSVGYPEPVAPGHLRPAGNEDRDRIVEWILDFRKAIGELIVHGDVRAEAEGLIRSGDLFFWCDPGPVCMVARALRTFTGISINHVYTPPQLRGRGYATSCVGELTRLLLNEGHDYCSLFTDVANPTSNSIYQKIGYRPVCDMRDVVFGKE